jgi:purine-binding chemotaxis protein CheW
MSIADLMDDGAAAGLEENVKLVTVVVGGQLFGIPIEKVRDVFVASDVTHVPMAPPIIAGLVNLRGKVVTLLSLRSALGFPDSSDSQMTVGIEWQGEAFGLLVDEVGEVLDLPKQSIERNPPNLNPNWMRLSVGVRRLEQRLLVQLDTNSIFNLPALAA